MNGSALDDRQNAPDGAGEAFPCTLLQQRLWADRNKNGSRGLNVAMRWLVEGRLSHGTAEAALRALVRRHEILRTSFREEGGKLVQVVAPTISFALRDIDLSPLSREEGEARAEEIARADAVAEIDPGRAPLLRATLLRLGPERAILLLTFHSLVADGWSIGLLVAEFRAAATAIDAGAAPDLSEPELPFADYALWEKEYLASGALDEARAYWRRRLDRAIGTAVPPDRVAAVEKDEPSRMVSILLPEALTRSVEAFARQHDVTLYGLAAASLALMLHRVTGDPDIVIGSQVANREDSAAENLVGPTVNSITLRLPVEDGASLRGFVRSVADRVQEALEHQRLPFEIAAGFAPGPSSAHGGRPLHAINLVVHRSYSGIAETDREAPGRFGLISLPSYSSGTTWDLNFYLIGRDEGWRLSCEADAALYAAATVQELLQAWHRCLEALATAPDGRLADLAALRGIAARAGATSDPHRYRPALYQPARLMPEKPRPAAVGEAVPFPDPERQIVRFHEEGGLTPLIALNNHSVYYQLARQLGHDRPFIDIQLHHPAGPAAVAPNSFEAFAAYAVRFIRWAQPHGPYIVGGHCVYGALAFECARQLQAAGDEVLLVALFDSWAPGYREDMSPRDRQLRQRRLRRLAYVQRFGQFRRGEIGFREIVWKPLLRRFGLIAPDPIPEQPASQWFDDYLQDAAELHRPAPYDGDVVLFRSAETLRGRLFDELMGWGPNVTGKLTKIEVSGAHLAMFRERPAGEIAAALGGILAEKESR